MVVRAFIQARMSSARFPGKVLAPLWGKPVLRHVVEALEQGGLSRDQVVILTSIEVSDDPVAAYVPQLGCSLFRGDLKNVLKRYEAAAQQFPCQWILRVTGDSPLCPPELVTRMLYFLPLPRPGLLTTTFRRTLPKGMNLEAFPSDFPTRELGAPDLTEEDCEHVTSRAHRQVSPAEICSVELKGQDFSGWSCAIDDVTDLARWNAQSRAELPAIPWHTLEAAW